MLRSLISSWWGHSFPAPYLINLHPQLHVRATTAHPKILCTLGLRVNKWRSELDDSHYTLSERNPSTLSASRDGLLLQITLPVRLMHVLVRQVGLESYHSVCLAFRYPSWRWVCFALSSSSAVRNPLAPQLPIIRSGWMVSWFAFLLAPLQPHRELPCHKQMK